MVHPIWGAISSDEFMKIFNQRESEYKDLLRKFDQFLQEKKEVDKLIEEKKKITFQNCVDKQKEVVRELTEKKGSREKLLSTVREVENGLKNQLESLEIRKSKGDKKYRCLSALLGGIIILIAAFCAVIANHLYQGSKTFEAIISTCGFITPIIMLALYVINSDKVTLAGVAKAISPEPA